MDFSKFSDSDFEVKRWVNGALAARRDSTGTLDVRGEGIVRLRVEVLPSPRVTPPRW